jgi:hypothetical protein
VRNEDLSVETAVKEIAGLLATAYQRYIKVARLAPGPPDDELDTHARKPAPERSWPRI